MKFFMPLLFLALIVLVIISCVMGDLDATLKFMFDFKPSEISIDIVVLALGQAFFTIGAGASAGIVLGSYLKEGQQPIMKLSLTIAGLDTFVAVLAGFAVFPIVFAFGIPPSAGEKLVFIALPLAFSEIPGGQLIYFIFMGTLALAGLSSALVIFEIPLSWVVENFKTPRKTAIFILAIPLWITMLLVSFSFNLLDGFYPLWFIEKFATMGMFELIQYVSIFVLIPLGGILVTIFVGHFVDINIVKSELGLGDSKYANVLLSHVRYVIPIALLVVLVSGL